MSSPYDLVILADTPVGYWKIDELTGVTAFDSSGNGLDGTFQVVPSLGNAALAPGLGTCANFSTGGGGGAPIVVPHDSLFDFASGSFTLECWLNFPPTGAGFTEFLTKGFGTSYRFLLDSQAPEYWVAVANAADPNPLSNATTYHLVTVVDSVANNSTIWVNGILVATGTYVNGSTDTTSPLCLAALRNTSGGFIRQYSGLGSNFAIYASALTGAQVLAHYTAGITSPVTVPNVVGDDDATARAAIIAAGLTVGTVTTAVDPSAVGTVLSQSPIAGSAANAGDPVSLVESAGPATVVPNVIGLLDAAARAAITAAALTASATIITDLSPAGTVLSQAPAGGSAASFGDLVILEESSGPATGTVPDVTGLTIAAASAAIVAAGFSVGTIDVPYNNTVPAGQVFDQSPAGGSTAFVGSPVDIIASNGPEPLTVPNVIGMTDADAASLLTSLLLRHTVTFGFNTVVPAGIIYSQAPSAGQPIAQGGTVSYIVSLGPPVPLLIVPFNVEQTVISQYANSPTLLQLIQNMNAYIDPATNFAAFFNNIWNIDTADTFGLNIWGRILGVSRVIPIPGDNDSFGFDNADSPPDWQTWGNALDPLAGGPFFGGQIGTGSYTLDDAAYRTLLLAKALANIANMSAPSLNQLVSNLFPGRGRAFTTNGRNMTMTYVFEFALSTIELAILQSSGVLPNPAGVTVGITVTP